MSSKLLSKCFQSELNSKSFQSELKVLPKCFHSASKVLSQCFQSASKVPPKCLQSASTCLFLAPQVTPTGRGVISHGLLTYINMVGPSRSTASRIPMKGKAQFPKIRLFLGNDFHEFALFSQTGMFLKYARAVIRNRPIESIMRML